MDINCSSCGKSYPHTIEFFKLERNGKLGRKCKECRRAYSRGMAKQYRDEKRPALVRSQNKWRSKNPQHVKKWRQSHPGQSIVYKHTRRAILKDRGTFSEKEFKEKFIKEFKGCCAYCKKRIPYAKIQRDHFIPVSKGGMNTIDNIVPACRSCNLKKYNTHPIHFMEKPNANS